MLGVGLAAVVSGCSALPASRSGPAPAAPPLPPLPPVPRLPPPLPGPSSSAAPPGEPELPPPAVDPEAWKGVLRHGPPGNRQVALTIDDGACADCVAGYVDLAQRTGIHLTFSPNGMYDREWSPHAVALRPLIEFGQVQIINHTYNHPRLTWCSKSRIMRELERNEAWITHTFAAHARPYYRPPFGVHSSTVDEYAAELGFDRVVLWDGSYSDSTLITAEFLMSQARRYLQPGVIMLGHANHPTVLGLFDEILDLIARRQLEPVTLHEMFGTAPEPPAPDELPPDRAIPI